MVGYMRVGFAQVGESDDVTCLVVVAPFVGHPHFYLVDSYATGDIGHGRHSTLILVAEEVTQEKMSVFIVLVARYIKLGHLCAALGTDGLAL